MSHEILSLYQHFFRYEIKLPPPVDSETNRIDFHKDPNVETGVLCFDFSVYNPKVIIAGLEGGVVLHTSALEKSELKGYS